MKILRTPSLGSNFTGSYKKRVYFSKKLEVFLKKNMAFMSFSKCKNNNRWAASF